MKKIKVVPVLSLEAHLFVESNNLIYSYLGQHIFYYANIKTVIKLDLLFTCRKLGFFLKKSFL